MIKEREFWKEEKHRIKREIEKIIYSGFEWKKDKITQKITVQGLADKIYYFLKVGKNVRKH